MNMVQRDKEVVWDFWRSLERGTRTEQEALFTSHIAEDIQWQGPHPFNRISGRDELVNSFWVPLLHSFPDLQRRTYIFFGGHFRDGDWVLGMGDFIGTFVSDWIGLPASGSSIHMRFGEFSRIEAGRIQQIYTIIDIPSLVRQLGFSILPPNTARDLWTPGPIEGDGLVFTEAASRESQKTLKLVEAMIFDGLLKYDQRSQDSQGLERYWHPDMVWHGPTGIGSAYGLEAFKRTAQRPFLEGFPDRSGGTHQVRLAEGCFAASTGWPSFFGTHTGEFLGQAPTGKQIGMPIIDVWKRKGELLAENWVLIDFLAVFKQMGVDLIAQVSERRGQPTRFLTTREPGNAHTRRP